jgi:hypothetical protein
MNVFIMISNHFSILIIQIYIFKNYLFFFGLCSIWLFNVRMHIWIFFLLKISIFKFHIQYVQSTQMIGNLSNFIEIKVQLYLLYNRFANIRVQKNMWPFQIAQMFYALHHTYILPHIFEFKPQKLPYNYHMIFKSISPLVKTIDMTSILIHCTLPKPNYIAG